MQECVNNSEPKFIPVRSLIAQLASNQFFYIKARRAQALSSQAKIASSVNLTQEYKLRLLQEQSLVRNFSSGCSELQIIHRKWLTWAWRKKNLAATFCSDQWDRMLGFVLVSPRVIFSWRCPKWTWLVEFVELNARFSLELEQLLESELIKDN